MMGGGGTVTVCGSTLRGPRLRVRFGLGGSTAATTGGTTIGNAGCGPSVTESEFRATVMGTTTVSSVGPASAQ